MNKYERKYLYELIEKFLILAPHLNNEEQECGLSVLCTIRQCEENKTKYNNMIKDIEKIIQEWKEDEEDEEKLMGNKF